MGMTELHLSSQEKIALESQHQRCRDRKEADRLKAILLCSEGWSVAAIAQALRLHLTTVSRHLEDHQAGKLKNTSGGSESSLDARQTTELVAHLESQTYHHNHEIVATVKERYGVTYTLSGMHKWLRRHGFTYKKPKGIPYKSDPLQQKEFMAHYEALKNTVAPDEPIVFMDAVHPTQATKISYGWIKKGQDKTVGTTASRTRLNIVGAIEIGRLKQTLTQQYDTVNAESIIDFMNGIRNTRLTAQKIHLILDQSGYHRSKAVAQQARQLGLELHFLPPYSPNLNPIERLWKVMNERVRNNRFFERAKDFRDAITEFFQTTLPQIGHTLHHRINDHFQLLKT